MYGLPDGQIDAADAVDLLDDVRGGDPEADHGYADEVLLRAVDPAVRAAYDRLVRRSAWWAAA